MSDDDFGRWPVRLEIPVAWGDMDAFAHVNNTVYLRWFESARIAYFERAGMIERMQKERVGPILGRATIDFRLPVTYPDTIVVEATVLRVGKTSIVMAYRARSRAHGGAIAAEGEGVLVQYDYANGTKVEIDDTFKARLVALEASMLPSPAP